MQRYRLRVSAVTFAKKFISRAALPLLPRFGIVFSNRICMKKLLRPRPFFTLMCLVLALAACRVNDDTTDEPTFTSGSEYRIDLFEQRDATDGTPTFGLWVERLALSECEGYGVDATVKVENGRIEVTLLGVLPPPTPCSGDSAPARQFLPIGNLTDGTYKFDLLLRDVIVNEGVLTVSNGRSTLSLPDAQGVEIGNFVVESLPDGVVWGYADTPDEASQPVADNFLVDLKTLTNEHGLAPGFYSYFTVAGTGDIFFHSRIAPQGTAKLFVRRLSASPDALRGLLQNYRDAAPQPLSIKCWTTQGEF